MVSHMVDPVILGALVGLLIMILAGVPLLVAFGLTSSVLYWQTSGAMITIGQMSTDGIKSFTLLAVPLFIVTGDLIVATGVAKELYNLAESVFGWVPGGLGVSTQAACGLFAAISGSNTADAAAIGRVSSAELVSRGYPRDYSGGLIASAAITGILIPPSISYIVLGMVMRTSISDLFIGTIIPGILVIGLMMVMHMFLARRRGIDQDTDSFDVRDVGKYAWRAKYGLMVPLIILGGLYAGIFTPTESATVAIAFMIGVGVLITRNFGADDYSDVILRSAALNGMISPLVAIFTLFSQALGFYQIPSALTSFLFNVSGGSEILILIMITLILILAGTVISTIPNILLFGPLLIPVGVQLGYGVIHFSIFFLCVLALGFITPPVGLNLFVLSGVIDEPVENVALHAIPFFFTGLLAALLILMFPSTVTVMLSGA
jgi:tripartite ATP-independent transporter DctM subunit